jgi:hypothetical protein
VLATNDLDRMWGAYQRPGMIVICNGPEQQHQRPFSRG